MAISLINAASTGASSGTIMTGSGNGAWTAYTPTVTPLTGSISSYTASGQYQTIGKTCIANFNITITTVGTAGGACGISLPFTGAGYIQIPGYGMEVNTNGSMLKGYLGASSTTMQITSYSNGSPFSFGNGSVFVMTAVYQIA